MDEQPSSPAPVLGTGAGNPDGDQNSDFNGRSSLRAE